MGLAGTALVYLLLGAVVAIALGLRGDDRTPGTRVAYGLAGLFFWPLFAPLLLGGRSKTPAPAAPSGALDERIHRAEELLVAALARVEGVAEGAVAPEVARVRALAGAMASMERRVKEMNALLASREFDAAAAAQALETLARRALAPDDPRVASVKARQRNIERLTAMRDRTADDLERIILQLEEMSSQIGLLKFAGRSDAEVVRMIKEIADSVEAATESLLETG